MRRALLVGPFDRPPTHPFVPHVTLRNPAPPEVVERASGALAAFRATVTFDGVDLLEERDRVWRPVADAPFGVSARAVVGRGSLPLELAESTHLDPVGAAFAAREWRLHDEATYGPGTRWEQRSVRVHRPPRRIGRRRRHRVDGSRVSRSSPSCSWRARCGARVSARTSWPRSSRSCAHEAARPSRCGPRPTPVLPRSTRRRGWRVEATFRDWLAGRDFVQLRRTL